MAPLWTPLLIAASLPNTSTDSCTILTSAAGRGGLHMARCGTGISSLGVGIDAPCQHWCRCGWHGEGEERPFVGNSLIIIAPWIRYVLPPQPAHHDRCGGSPSPSPSPCMLCTPAPPSGTRGGAARVAAGRRVGSNRKANAAPAIPPPPSHERVSEYTQRCIYAAGGTARGWHGL